MITVGTGSKKFLTNLCADVLPALDVVATEPRRE